MKSNELSCNAYKQEFVRLSIAGDYINRNDVLYLCSASSPCVFLPEDDNLDVRESCATISPTRNEDFDPIFKEELFLGLHV